MKALLALPLAVIYIRTGLDALEFLLAGASAVSVGTTVFGDPSAPVRVLRELEQGATGDARQQRARAVPV